jgi:tetratricopeptide (TPR) repeat protein
MPYGLIVFAGSPSAMVYWRDYPNQFTSREVLLAELTALTAKSEADYYALSDPDLVAVGKQLYRWLDGSGRWLARELDDLDGSIVGLLIEATPALAALPWETLHDGTTFLVRRKNAPVVPVRWRPQGPPARPVANRTLHVLFMATSPLGVKPELNFEQEEATILKETERHPITLTVEETGSLTELKVLTTGMPDDSVDVLHLTGHADHTNDGPRFLTEDDAGQPKWASTAEIAKAVPRRPRLTFLSGCRSAQMPKGGAVRSLAEQLLDERFPAVLGWGRPVADSEATLAAAELYKRLGEGFSPVEALVEAHRELEEKKAKHWHLLRLFVAGDLPTAVVTAPRTPGRKPPLKPRSQGRFIGKSQNVGTAVVGRSEFVGRRRPLQRFIRRLRNPQQGELGGVVFGPGGVGKSSLACRICDRLTEFDPLVLVGILDEPALLQSLVNSAGLTDDQMADLQGSKAPLPLRLKRFLERRRDDGCKTLLLVLDDFEQNFSDPKEGTPQIMPTAQGVLAALVTAMDDGNWGRCLITSRYELTTTQGGRFYQEPLAAMGKDEVIKKRRSLLGLVKSPADLRDRAETVAQGNPRLLERLDQLLKGQSVEFGALLAKMEAVAAEFREQLCLRELLAGLPDSAQRLLGLAVPYRVPVKFSVLARLDKKRNEMGLWTDLNAAVAVGLCECDAAREWYRVSQLLLPILPEALIGTPDAAAASLFVDWFVSKDSFPEALTLDLIRLTRRSRNPLLSVPVTVSLGMRWRRSRRYVEAHRLYEESLSAVGREYELLEGYSDTLHYLGEGEAAFTSLQEALQLCPISDTKFRYGLLCRYSDQLQTRGRLDEALEVLRGQAIPILEELRDEGARAATMGHVAAILEVQGKLSESLDILREQFSTFKALGENQNAARTRGRMASIQARQGRVEEALRIYRDELLPEFTRLGDMRSRAEVWGGIADIVATEGNIDEAIRIYREEQLPTFERLEDEGAIATAQGRTADLLERKGLIEEALRIRLEEELPRFEQLADAHAAIETRERIALLHLKCGQVKVAQAVWNVSGSAAIKADLPREISVEDLLALQELGNEFQRSGTLGQQAFTLEAIANLQFGAGRVDESATTMLDVVKVLTQLDDSPKTAAAMMKTAVLLKKSCRIPEAIAVLEELGVFCEVAGLQQERRVAMTWLMNLLLDQATLLVQNCHWEEAESVQQKLFRLADQLSDTKVKRQVAENMMSLVEGYKKSGNGIRSLSLMMEVVKLVGMSPEEFAAEVAKPGS